MSVIDITYLPHLCLDDGRIAVFEEAWCCTNCFRTSVRSVVDDDDQVTERTIQMIALGDQAPISWRYASRAERRLHDKKCDL